MRTRVVLALLAVSLVTVACGDDTSVFDLAVGDCFNDDAAAADVVQTVATVRCSEPHDNEIFFEFSMTDASFPGQEATATAAGARCVAEFEGFVGLSYEESDLDLFPIIPTVQSWADGSPEESLALRGLDVLCPGSMRLAPQREDCGSLRPPFWPLRRVPATPPRPPRPGWRRCRRTNTPTSCRSSSRWWPHSGSG